MWGHKMSLTRYEDCWVSSGEVLFEDKCLSFSAFSIDDARFNLDAAFKIVIDIEEAPGEDFCMGPFPVDMCNKKIRKGIDCAQGKRHSEFYKIVLLSAYGQETWETIKSIMHQIELKDGYSTPERISWINE